MLRQNLLLIATSIALALVGCKSRPNPNAPFPKVELGMTLDEVKPFLDGPGEQASYDNLPAAPKPREIYSKLPQSVEWQVWAAPGKPTLILGVLNAKIVFKQVFWMQDGERKGDASVLPDYQ